MNFFLNYLINRLLFRIYKFLYNWYILGSKWILHYYISILKNLDYKFAVKANIHHFFEPLYKDYSFIGIFLGLFFRFFRILIGGLIYLIISFLSLIILLIWIFIPIIILIFIIIK